MYFKAAHLVAKSLDFVLIESVLAVAGLHGGCEALYFSIQHTHHIFKRPRLHLQVLAAAAQICHLGLLAVEL